MTNQWIVISEIFKGMNFIEQKNMACKCRKASQMYSEVAAFLDEAGVALENDNFNKCVAELKKAKLFLE